MAALSEAITSIVMEDLAPGVRDGLIEIDDFFRMLLDDNVSSFRDEHVGRNWKIIHVFLVSLAGHIRAQRNMRGDTLDYVGDTSMVYGAYEASDVPSGRPQGSNLATWPGVAWGLAPGYVSRTIELKRWRGTMYVPLTLFRSDRLNAAIGQQVVATVKQTTRNIALAKANLFFAISGTHKQIGTVGSSITDGGVGVRNVTFTLAAGSRIRRFQPGQFVEIRDASNAYALLNDGAGTGAGDPRALVTKVDPIDKKVTIQHVLSSAGWEAAVAENDIVVMAGSYDATNFGYGPSGLEYWIRPNTATDVYGLDFTKVPQFASQRVTISPSGPLTQEILRQYLGNWMDTHSVDQWPDCLVTTAGVLADYVGEADTLRLFNVQGEPTDVQGGFAGGPSYSYEGRRLPFKTSPLVAGKTLYALKLKNNIRRYTPPLLPGAGTDSRFQNADVEFIAPLLGFKSIWTPVQYKDEYTEYMGALFEICEEYAPEVLPTLRIDGLGEFSV